MPSCGPGDELCGSTRTVFPSEARAELASLARVEGPCVWLSERVCLQSDRVFPELLVDQPRDERLQPFTGFFQNKVVRRWRPVQLEARGQCRNPDLAYRRIGRNHKPRRRVLERNVQRARLIFHLEVG